MTDLENNLNESAINSFNDLYSKFEAMKAPIDKVLDNADAFTGNFNAKKIQELKKLSTEVEALKNDGEDAQENNEKAGDQEKITEKIKSADEKIKDIGDILSILGPAGENIEQEKQAPVNNISSGVHNKVGNLLKGLFWTGDKGLESHERHVFSQEIRGASAKEKYLTQQTGETLAKRRYIESRNQNDEDKKNNKNDDYGFRLKSLREELASLQKTRNDVLSNMSNHQKLVREDGDKEDEIQQIENTIEKLKDENKKHEKQKQDLTKQLKDEEKAKAEAGEGEGEGEEKKAALQKINNNIKTLTADLGTLDQDIANNNKQIFAASENMSKQTHIGNFIKPLLPRRGSIKDTLSVKDHKKLIDDEQQAMLNQKRELDFDIEGVLSKISGVKEKMKGGHRKIIQQTKEGISSLLGWTKDILNHDITKKIGTEGWSALGNAATTLKETVSGDISKDLYRSAGSAALETTKKAAKWATAPLWGPAKAIGWSFKTAGEGVKNTPGFLARSFNNIGRIVPNAFIGIGKAPLALGDGVVNMVRGKGTSNMASAFSYIKHIDKPGRSASNNASLAPTPA
jgi:hypothetical protein